MRYSFNMLLKNSTSHFLKLLWICTIPKTETMLQSCPQLTWLKKHVMHNDDTTNRTSSNLARLYNFIWACNLGDVSLLCSIHLSLSNFYLQYMFFHIDIFLVPTLWSREDNLPHLYSAILPFPVSTIYWCQFFPEKYEIRIILSIRKYFPSNSLKRESQDQPQHTFWVAPNAQFAQHH